VKALEVVSKAVKTVAAAVTGSAPAERPRSRHAVEELQRRAEINARGAAVRAELAGGGRGWLPPGGAGWLRRRGR
jgi:hypothetical protein